MRKGYLLSEFFFELFDGLESGDGVVCEGGEFLVEGLFVCHEVLEGGLEENGVDYGLDDRPEGTDGTVDFVCASGIDTGVMGAKGVVEKPATKIVHDICHKDG